MLMRPGYPVRPALILVGVPPTRGERSYSSASSSNLVTVFQLRAVAVT